MDVTLFRKNALGIGVWRVWRQPLDSATRGLIMIGHSSVEGGAMVTHYEEVVTNNSGRSLDEQVILQIKSRIGRQKDKGYKETREEAALGSTNQLGLVNPMLALPIGKTVLYQEDMSGAHVQPKYNGHRCLITKQGGEMLAYSRKGKPITTIPGILADAERWTQEGDTLDGELYIHGRSLQSLSSIIKAEQPESALLNYMWYDMADSTRTFAQRLRTMRELYANCEQPRIQLVPTYEVKVMREVYDFFRGFREMGFEGAMLRLNCAGYEDARRVRQLLKVKERMDCEVTVLSARPSSLGWAVLTVALENGKTFDVSAPGTIEEKHEVMANIAAYVGRRLKIEFAEYTDDGVPFHAVATEWYTEV